MNETIKINIYHADFLPDNVNINNLYRWWGVYLHGRAEFNEGFNEDSPDIFLSDIPFDNVENDKNISVNIHNKFSSSPGFAFIWLAEDGKRIYRKGLIVKEGDTDSIDYATECFDKQVKFL